jgi:hypothetical protein
VFDGRPLGRLMARWADYPTPEEEAQLKRVLSEIRGLKPTGWSIVLGDRQLLLRPKNRQRGKVSLTVSGSPPRLGAMFYSHALGHWAASTSFPFDPASAPLVIEWANAQNHDEEGRWQ